MLDVELMDMVTLISNSLNTFTSCLFLVEQETGKLKISAVHSLSNHISNNLSLDIGQGMIGWIASNQKPLNIAKYRWDKKHFQMYRKDESINSFLGVPVLNGDKLLGVLCVDSKKQYVFTTKIQKIVLGFANQISLILKRYDVLEREKSRSEYYERLFYFCRELSNFKEDSEFYNTVISLSCEILGADFCIISLLDKVKNVWKIRAGNGYLSEFQKKRTFPLNQGLSSVTLKEEKPLLIPSLNISKDRSFAFCKDEPKWMLKSYIGVKLEIKGEIIGLLHFISKKSNQFAKEDVEIAGILAKQTTVSMQNNQLFQRVNETNCLDQLTGLNNHISCQRKILSAIESASYLKPVSLLIIDIDQFGDLNDRYGFDIGDHVLRKLSAILVSILKEKDFVGRYGNDEFVILLKNTRQKDALIVAERVKQVIERSIFTLDDLEANITLSIGISVCPMHAKSRSFFTETAFHALNNAKNSGGKTICVFK